MYNKFTNRLDYDLCKECLRTLKAFNVMDSEQADSVSDNIEFMASELDYYEKAQEGV